MISYATTLDEVLALRSENAQLRAALEPFANLAEHIFEGHKDSRPILYGIGETALRQVTIGDLRRAKSALTDETRK